MKCIKFGTILFIATVLIGFSSPIETEKPEKLDWSLLSGVDWVMEDGYYTARFSDRQKELDGMEVVIEGFMFPLEYTRQHRNFIISASPMSNCFFCGPGEAESMVLIQSQEGVEHSNRTLKMKGTFKLVSDPSKGILYELENASLVK